jgi:hypothetical protein
VTFRATALLLAAGCLAAIIAAPAAVANPQCTVVAQGTTRCGSPGNAQIRTVPPPTSPFVRYGCTAGFTSFCDFGFPGIAINVRPSVGR